MRAATSPTARNRHDNLLRRSHHDTTGAPLNLETIHVNADTGETDAVSVEPGWFRCTQRKAYYVHDHDSHYVSHFPRDKFAGCL